MKYFLASSHCQQGTPVLMRDNGFNILLKSALGDKPLKMLIIASDPDNSGQNDTFARWEQDRFEKDGYTVESCKILDRRNAHTAGQLVAESNFIMLYGGHLPTQNKFFCELGLKDLLAGFGGIILGISAGSMNCAGTVYVTPEMPGEAVDPAFRRFVPGLCITDINIIPHYNMVKDDVLDGMKLFEEIIYPDSHGRQFVVIPDSSFVYGDGTIERLYGEGFILADGVMTPVKDIVL